MSLVAKLVEIAESTAKEAVAKPSMDTLVVKGPPGKEVIIDGPQIPPLDEEVIVPPSLQSPERRETDPGITPPRPGARSIEVDKMEPRDWEIRSEGPYKVTLEPNIATAQFSSLRSLESRNAEVRDIIETPQQIQEGLTDEERLQIKNETGWSDEIINSIKSMDQYEIYKKADLTEAEINGRKCLVKKIDFDYVDEKTGLTNRELMERGRSPIDPKTGEKIELHHMGQDYDAPFAELNENSEHGDGNHSTLHPKTEGSWRNTPELNNQYQNEKREYWKARAKSGE